MEEFNISEFFKYYVGKIAIVLLTTAIFFTGSIYYTAKMQVPMYKSEAKIVLTNQSAQITQNDIVINKNLVSTYREIIKSRRILSQVIENLNLDLTIEKLNKKVKVSSANDTEMIIISVVDESKSLSRDIANEIAVIFKKEIVDIYKIENITIVDNAVDATTAYNVQPLKQYILGFGLGFIIGTGLIVLMFYFDDSIKSSEQIETKLGLSVLSQVPKYRSNKKKKNNNEGDE